MRIPTIQPHPPNWRCARSIADAACLAALALALPATATADPWPLDRVLEAVRRADPGVEAARQGASAERLEKKGAMTSLSPRLTLQAEALRSDDPALLFSERLRQGRFTEADFALGALNRPSVRSSLDWGLVLEQPIFNGGSELTAPALAAQHRRAADAAGAARVADRLLIAVERYVEALRATNALAADSFAEVAAMEHLRASVERFRLGQVAELDTLRAAARWAEARASMADASATCEAGLRRLSSLTGAPVGAGDLVPPPSPLDGATSPAPAERGEIRAARALAAAGRIEARRAGLSLLPSLNGRLGVRYYRPVEEGPDVRRWTGSIVMEFPLWDGTARARAWKAARARARQAAAEADLIERDLNAEADAARREITTARERVEALRAANVAREEALRLSARRYRAGLLTLGELLSADSEAARSRHEQVDADARVSLAAYRYLHAIGGLQ
jgi:outer membrane protein TolC